MHIQVISVFSTGTFTQTIFHAGINFKIELNGNDPLYIWGLSGGLF